MYLYKCPVPELLGLGESRSQTAVRALGAMLPHPSFKNALCHGTAWVRDGMEPVQRLPDKAVPKGSKYLNIHRRQA